jgi:hypothetical protein
MVGDTHTNSDVVTFRWSQHTWGFCGDKLLPKRENGKRDWRSEIDLRCLCDFVNSYFALPEGSWYSMQASLSLYNATM